MPEAVFTRDWDEQFIQAAAAVAVGEVWQTADGKAAVMSSSAAVGTGNRALFSTSGKYAFPLASSVTILAGGRVYWDHSANTATYKKVNDRDFYLGRAVEDTSSTTVVVDINSDPAYDIDITRDAFLSVPVGTQAVGGFGYPKRLGGAHSIELTATSEAQKIDILSVDGFAPGTPAIVEGIFRIPSDGSNATQDFRVGIANGTNATDADSITESLFLGTDGGSTNIIAESDDGSTEVAATDTTKDYTEGSAVANRVEFWIDLRDDSDPQLYVNGENVLPSSVFDVSAASGPWFLLAHLEKSSSTDTYAVAVDALRVRFMEQ